MGKSQTALLATKPVKASQLYRTPARKGPPAQDEPDDPQVTTPVGRLQRKSKSGAAAKYQDLLPKRRRADTIEDPPPSKKKKTEQRAANDESESINIPPSAKRTGVPKRKVVPVNRYEDDDDDADDVAFAQAAQAQQKQTRTVKTKATPAKKSTRSIPLDDVSGEPAGPGSVQSDEDDPQDAAFAGPGGSASEENEEGSHDSSESGDDSDSFGPSTAKQALEQEVPTWAGSVDGDGNGNSNSNSNGDDDDDDDGLPESFTAPSRPKVTKTYGRSSSASQNPSHAPTQDTPDQEPENDHRTMSADKKSSAARSSAKKCTGGPASLFDADNTDVRRGSSRAAGHGARASSSKSRPITSHTHGPKKTSKGATKASSRRQQKAKMEQPSFESSDSDASDESDADMDVDTDNIPHGGRCKVSGRHKWPEFTDLSYNKTGKINKLVQSDEMRRFIEECSEWVIHNIAFITFYPEGKDKYAYLIRLMMKVSEDGEFPIIAARMRSDPVYARDLTHIPSNNVSHYRKNVLRAICPLVDAAYNLSRPAQPGAPKRTINEIKARVAALKVKRCYLFALAPGDGVQCISAKPFEHPMVAIALRAAFFGSTGPTSIGTEYAHELVSSVDSDNDPEVPLSMLAMVATIISYVLDGWSTGLYSPGKFHVETLSGTYEGMLKFIEVIRSRTNDAKFHRMRANCLKAARHVDHTAESTMVTAQEDAADIDFDNMEE
ncbi:hypothetical protein EUX98_g6790 [Antrodiella citrinella]|uniref:DUF6532 domain-containing protein n=1 Tax=Antrodiella citrinella TaxID=2447956 RepID=A0A4S4MNX6_9APHY|nr:hypothetical protein EUX98_g6790 [Antrodiella citrinella]